MVTENKPQQNSVDITKQNNTDAHQQSNFSIDIPMIGKFDFKNVGTYGLKTGFISLVSVILLVYAFLILRIPINQSIIVISFLGLFFLIIWKFGCNDSSI